MTAVSVCLMVVLLLPAGLAVAQEMAAPVPVAEEQAAPAKAEIRRVQLQELELMALGALRQEFPRLAIMTSTSSCRLPEYGPLVNISLQLPPVYFTGPVLKLLEKKSREAEILAGRWREQMDRMAETFRMRERESELVRQIEFEQTRKKPKATVSALQAELDNVRKSIAELENGASLPIVEAAQSGVDAPDLEKMMADNYQTAIQKIGAAMQNVLVNRAVDLEDLQSGERICIATHVRDNFLSGQQRSILFILNPEDIDAYRSGRISREDLRKKVLVKDEAKE